MCVRGFVFGTSLNPRPKNINNAQTNIPCAWSFEVLNNRFKTFHYKQINFVKTCEMQFYKAIPTDFVKKTSSVST